MNRDITWSMGANGVARRDDDPGEVARIEEPYFIAETDSANFTGCGIWIPLHIVAQLLRSAGYLIHAPGAEAKVEARGEGHGTDPDHVCSGACALGYQADMLRASGYEVFAPGAQAAKVREALSVANAIEKAAEDASLYEEQSVTPSNGWTVSPPTELALLYKRERDVARRLLNHEKATREAIAREREDALRELSVLRLRARIAAEDAEREGTDRG